MPAVTYSLPSEVELIRQGSDLIALVGNRSGTNINRLNFGNSIINIPSGTDINVASSSKPRSLDVVRDCDQWHVFVSSEGNKKIHRLDFGTSLLGSATQTDLVLTGDPMSSNPFRTEVCYDAGVFYGILSSSGGQIFRVDLGSDVSMGTGLVDDLGDFGLFSSTAGFDIVKDTAGFIGFGVGSGNNRIDRIIFSTPCPSPVRFSTEMVPIGVNYTSAGPYLISLETRDSNGNVDRFSQGITVTSSQAPEADFTIDNNRCLSNPNSFTGIDISGDIVSWSWDFGDGSPLGSGTTENHQYLAADTFDVNLEVMNASGCRNLVAKELPIYNATVADFSFPLTTLCTAAPVQFTNASTGETGLAVLWSWDFAGGGNSNDSDPEFIFSTPGIKSVELMATIPGCTSTVQKNLNLLPGPNVGFSFTNNCFGEEMQFTDETIGTGIIGYTWDFGDMSGSSSQDPVHTYAIAGNYPVSLNVENTDGCVNEFVDTVRVNDGTLADFDTDDLVVNVPSQFYGADLTLIGDSIVSWDWDFEGMGTDSVQVPTFAFTAAGDFEIQLEVVTTQGCEFGLTKMSSVNPATCPSAGFAIPSAICRDEELVILNESVNGDSYLWDFCAGGLASSPVADSVVAIPGTTPTGLTTVLSDGNWYAFATDRGSNKIFLIDFGVALTDSVDATDVFDLGNVNGLFNGPEGIAIHKEGGNWFGLVLNYNDDKIIRLDFGSSLTNSTLSAQEIVPDPPVTFSQPSEVELVNHGGDLIALVGNRSGTNINRLNFGNSITNTPEGTDLQISGSSQPRSLGIVQECDQWHVFVSSELSRTIHRLDFGPSLLGNAIQTDLVLSGDTLTSNIFRTEILHDAGNFYAILSSVGGEILRVHLGQDITADSGIVKDFGNFGLFSSTAGFDIVQDTSGFVGLGIGSGNNRVDRVVFSANCPSSIRFSSEETPIGVEYGTAGDFGVSLELRDSNGNVNRFSQNITINTDQAPSVDFDFDSNRCQANPNTFQGVDISGTITSWAWDFDGISTAMGQIVSYQFDTAGTFIARLNVSDGTCNNTSIKPITLYNEPFPHFSVPADPLCSNTLIPFTNTTAGESGDSVQWVWDFNSEEMSVDKEPQLTFLSGGSKSVTLTATIPGCTNQFDTTLNVLVGPEAGFAFENTCFGDLTKFSNTSVGSGIIGYSWDFGNGVGSSLPNPAVVYDSNGVYNASLSVDNDLGCTTTTIDTLTIHAVPQADFGNDLTCRGVEIQFYDSSVVENANVDSWLWTIESVPDPTDVVMYEDQNPAHRFAFTGIYQVQLLATSIYGCSDSVSKTLEVLESPDVDFSWLLPCLGDTVQFLDLSQGTESATPVAWAWNILDQTLLEQNPGFSFPSADTFAISLSVTSQNLCTVDSVKNLVIKPLPAPGFLVEDACANLLTQFSDTSRSEEPITAWEWTLADLGQSFDQDVRFQFPSPGDYQIALAVTTASGCANELLDTVTIHDFPVADFEVSESIGAAPFLVEFFNNSQGAINYSWDFATGDSSTEPEPVFEFQNLGSYAVDLRATNEQGCEDAFSRIVKVVVPKVDVGLEEIRSVIDQDRLQIILTIVNNGNLVVKNLDIIIEIPGQLALVENIQAPIGPDERLNYRADFEILNAPSGASHVCFNLVVRDPDHDELDPSDNLDCINLDEQAVFLEAYPNPLVDQLVIPLVLPVPNPVEFQLLSSDGALLLHRSYDQPSIGLNLFLLEMTGLRQGLYFLRTRYGTAQNIQKIVKE